MSDVSQNSQWRCHVRLELEGYEELNVEGTAEFLVAEPYGVVATKGKRRWVLRLTLTLDPTQQSKVDGNQAEVGR